MSRSRNLQKAGLLLLILAAASIAVGLVRLRPVAFTTVSGSTMGTTYTVRIAGSLAPAEQELWQRRVQQCLDGVDARMSTYRADSEVSRFNRSASTDWFQVSHETAFVVAVSLEVARQTEGAFDITVGPLVNLWNFGPDRRPVGIPSDAEIEAARVRVGYHHLKARLDPPALLKQIPDLAIDLSGIAKGFAVDQLGALLKESGVDGYMIEVGGEVRTLGRKGNGERWRIGVERPVVGRRLVQTVLELEDTSLATSGDYRNFFLWEGASYSHEIDPHTGRPVQHAPAAISVLATSAMRADAYATGLMVMPPDQAWQLAESLELDIMMVTRDPQGYQQRLTAGFVAAMLTDGKRGAP
ncbi:MAG: FAD:protein FMN transferase [Pirellulales bacterium]